MNTVIRMTKALFIAPLFLLACSASPEAAPGDETAAETTEEAVGYSGCWGKGPTVPEFGGYSTTKYCHAYTGGTVFGSMTGLEDVGYLDSGNSWFVCQYEGTANPPVNGGAVNHWWLWTKADRAHRGHDGWGWFPANRISGGEPNGRIPGLPNCVIEW